jgi:hypothetical protein
VRGNRLSSDQRRAMAAIEAQLFHPVGIAPVARRDVLARGRILRLEGRAYMRDNPQPRLPGAVELAGIAGRNVLGGGPPRASPAWDEAVAVVARASRRLPRRLRLQPFPSAAAALSFRGWRLSCVWTMPVADSLNVADFAHARSGRGPLLWKRM